MYRTTEKVQKRKDEKRRAFLSAAARVFSSKGYHDTTVKDIVKEAASSIGSFYFYFNSKDEIYLELYRSIVKEFSDISLRVIDLERFSLTKNYIRVMMATLWMYEQKRDIARIMLQEATDIAADIQKLEAEVIQASVQNMTSWFERFKSHDEVNIPDAGVAALMYEGSFRCFISTLLSSRESKPFTEYGYGFCVYNLQAIHIPIDETEIKGLISEVLKELSEFSNKQESVLNEEHE